MSIQRLQSHWGFTRMPFGRDLAPAMLHRHASHGEAVARITWCVDQRAIGVITGEVGAGKTVAVRGGHRQPGSVPARVHLPGQPHHRGARHAHPHRGHARAHPGLSPGHPGPPSRRRAGHRTRRTGPQPRARRRRSPPAGQSSARSDPAVDQPRHGHRIPVRGHPGRPTHPAPPAPARVCSPRWISASRCATPSPG